MLGLVGLGLWAGGVATDGVHVPAFLRDHRVRIANEQAVARCPAPLILHQPREGEADGRIAHHTRQLQNTGMWCEPVTMPMRTWYARGSRPSGSALAASRLIGIQLTIALLVHGESFRPKSKRLAIERRHDGVGRHDLRHAPVVGIMPAFVFVGVAFAAGGGAGVLIVGAPVGEGDRRGGWCHVPGIGQALGFRLRRRGFGFSGVVGRLIASNITDTTRMAISQRMVEGCQFMCYMHYPYAPDFAAEKKKKAHICGPS